MKREDILKKFESHCEYLRRNVPPDDIYPFAEQTHMAAMFFLHKLDKLIDVKAQCKIDPSFRQWVNNILGLVVCRDQNVDLMLDLGLDEGDL